MMDIGTEIRQSVKRSPLSAEDPAAVKYLLLCKYENQRSRWHTRVRKRPGYPLALKELATKAMVVNPSVQPIGIIMTPPTKSREPTMTLPAITGFKQAYHTAF